MDYGAELSAAWADHLAPRKPDARTVVSTFAGCGGSSLGYSMAGYRELLAVEWDDHAVAMLRRNFPELPIHHGDIAQVDPDALGLAPGELDVLDGSPPCQGFSIIGARKDGDDRNELFRQYVRLLEAWRPKAFVMENVPGMIIGKMRATFAEILGMLKGAGYDVAVRKITMSYFRVPQARHRLVFLGVRRDLGAQIPVLRPISAPFTCRQAWADLGSPGILAPMKGDRTPKLAALMPPGRNGAWVLKQSDRKRSWYGLQRLRYNAPALIITKTFRNGGGAGYLHPTENRFVGSAELTRVTSFPDEYDWGDSTYEQIHARLGNSVPPIFMRHVAQLMATTLDKVSA